MTKSEEILRSTLNLEIPGKGNKNISVKAGAGGGKTTMLSTRICAQIAQGTPIEDFVVITYTNAAAAELREKITARLSAFLKQSELDTKVKEYVAIALNSIELMQISTIHSFLFKILRENAFESRIVIDARLLDDVEEQTRKSSFFDKWYNEPSNFAAISAFTEDWTELDQYGNRRNHTREVFENMFYSLANVRENVVVDLTDHSADFLKMAQDYVNKWLPCMVNLKKAYLTNLPPKADGTPTAMLSGPSRMVDAVASVEGVKPADVDIETALELSLAVSEVATIVNDGKLFYRNDKNGNGASAHNAIEHLIPAIPDYELEWDFDKLYNKFLSKAEKASKVVNYVCQMQKAYQMEIDAETKYLSNDDILYRAEQLLLKFPDILDKYRSRYSKIYVDEFQDTTGIQTRIITLLSEKPGTKLEDNDLQHDKLLLVGDPKQSIYRFTGAEKAVYDQMDSMFASMDSDICESVTLESNFRSNSDIVDWVNRCFSMLMGASYTNMDSTWKVSNDKALHGVYNYVPTCEIAEYKADGDPSAVAALIKKICYNDTFFLEEYDRKTDTYRNRQIQYSDIMVVCKTTTHMSEYVDKFGEEGIPVNVQGKFKINEDPVLINFIILLSFLGNSKNLHRKMAAAQVVSGIDTTQVDKASNELALTELDKLVKLLAEKKLDIAAKVRYLLAHEELFIPKNIIYDSEEVRSYRIRLHQMTENCLAKNKGDMSELAALMEEYIGREVKREIPLVSNENAVRLMNVHQSKGLTGQIVIIADRKGIESCKYGGFKKAGNYYPAASYTYTEQGNSQAVIYPTYGYDYGMIQTTYKEETEEAIRLQYVAATRAAHALIFMPTLNKHTWFTDPVYALDDCDSEYYPTNILDWIKEREEDNTVYSVDKNDIVTVDEQYTLAQLEDNLLAVDWGKIGKSQMTSITPSGLEPNRQSGYSSGNDGYVKEKRPSGNIFGDVMHRVFEILFYRYPQIIDKDESERRSALSRIIKLAICEHKDDLASSDSAEYLDYLLPIMEDYLVRVVKPIMDNAEAVYPEYEFSFYVSEVEREGFLTQFGPYLDTAKEKISDIADCIWVNGKSDLVVKNKDGSVKVYDFKSDEMNGKPKDDFEKDMQDKYAGQLALYKYAIGKYFDVADIEAELIHLYR